MQPVYRCWAEVDLDALRQNLAWLRHAAGPTAKLMTIVKADAYGHGLKQIAALLMQSGTDVFGVANLGEAHVIRRIGRGWPILMLGACLPEEVEPAVRDSLMMTVSTGAEARLISHTAARLKRRAEIHIKVDTGMGRLGASPEDAVNFVRMAAGLPGVAVQGLFTHFSSAEDDADFSKAQAEKFRTLVSQLESENLRPPLIHAQNSAGFLFESESRYDLIRPGLLVYGIVPPGRRAKSTQSIQAALNPALSFKCRVSLIKTVLKGTPLSYGHTFIASRKLRIATLTAGYGDGCLRSGSGRAHVLIRGHLCPLVGRITMDQMLADVSRMPDVATGDEAILIGRSGAQSITACDVAEWCGTIPWEILTAITYRVPRIYKGGTAS